MYITIRITCGQFCSIYTVHPKKVEATWHLRSRIMSKTILILLLVVFFVTVNPQHAFAARIMVFGLCVCVCRSVTAILRTNIPLTCIGTSSLSCLLPFLCHPYIFIRRICYCTCVVFVSPCVGGSVCHAHYIV